MSFRYILEPYSGKKSRFACPSCKRNHQFTRYIDTQTGSYIAPDVGICNHKNRCGYHFPPKQYLRNNSIKQTFSAYLPRPVLSNPVKQVVDYINPVILKKSMNISLKNNLVIYLKSIIDSKKVMELANLYNIGAYSTGTTIFWQVDYQGHIRTGKLITYSAITGKRIKKLYPPANWVHSVMHPNGFNLKQCLFGEHLLLHYPNKPVAIVESEKTAIIASAKLPDFLWLATGSINEFKPSKLNILKDRRVIAFPDMGAYDYWVKKALLLPFYVEVSDYLENHSTQEQKKQGLDIADFL
jgi:hypothetical protein